MWRHSRTSAIASLAPFLTGRVDLARRLAIEGLEEERAAGGQASEAETQALHGLLALRDAECGSGAIGFSDAERWLRAALAIATALGMRPLEGHCHLILARVWRSLSRDAEAKEHLTTATTIYRELGMGWWLEQSQDFARG
jgi:hypothetical protein